MQERSPQAPPDVKTLPIALCAAGYLTTTAHPRRDERRSTMARNFEIDPERATELGAPVDDVAQEAIDATATLYADEAGVDVEKLLAAQLASRGLRAGDEQLITELAHEIRSGHHVRVGRSDGSVEDEGTPPGRL